MGAAAAAPEAQEAAQEAPEGDGKKKHLSNDKKMQFYKLFWQDRTEIKT